MNYRSCKNVNFALTANGKIFGIAIKNLPFMTTTEKQSIESLHQIINSLEREGIHMSRVHLNSAVELIEQKFRNNDYPQTNMSTVKYVLAVLERDMRLKTKADRRYYGRLIAMAGNDLTRMYSILYNRFHGMG